MICPNCNSENPDDAKICQKCEKELDPVSDLIKGETAYGGEALGARPKKKKSLTMIVGASALVVIFLVLFFLFTGSGVKGTVIADNVPQDIITIHLKRIDNNSTKTTQTDSMGRFSFTDLEPGEYSLIVFIPLPANYSQFGDNLVLLKGLEVRSGKSINQEFDINIHNTLHGPSYHFGDDYWVFTN